MKTQEREKTGAQQDGIAAMYVERSQLMVA